MTWQITNMCVSVADDEQNEDKTAAVTSDSSASGKNAENRPIVNVSLIGKWVK